MPLDAATARTIALLEGDVARMNQRKEQRIAGYDDMLLDEAMGICTFRRAGQVLWRARAETIATLTPEIGLLRWWFSWTSPGDARDKHRLSRGWREASRLGLQAMLHDTVSLDGHEAEGLVPVAAHLAGAEGVLRRQNDTDVTWIALFEPHAGDVPLDDKVPHGPRTRPEWMQEGLPLSDTDGDVQVAHFQPAKVGNARYSIAPPPPGATPRSAHRPTMGVRQLAAIPLSMDSLPDLRPPPVPGAIIGGTLPDPPAALPTAPQPQRASAPPPAPLPVREPSREVLMPLISGALGEIAAATPGFRQALVVVTVDVSESSKGRYLLQLVSCDAQGDLQVIDPRPELLERTGRMIGDDAKSGNGRWRRLVARLSSTPRGASVDVSVRA